MKGEEALFQELERERLEQEAAAAGVEPAKPSARFMIAGETPILMEKACEFMVKELTLRAWHHTEQNKRRTVQKHDVHAAVGENEMFDFLIDIVPRAPAPAPAPPPTATDATTAASEEQEDTNDSPSEEVAAPSEQQQEQPISSNMTDVEARYAQLQEMQGQMHEQYNILQQRVQADGSVATQQEQAVEGQGQQPQVVLNPQLVIHPPGGGAIPQWQPPAAPSPTDETPNPLSHPEADL